MKIKKLLLSAVLSITLAALLPKLSVAENSPFNVESFSKELNKRTKQTVLTGMIDSLTIIRGAAEFRMGSGKLTLFNFDAYRPSAMVYEGQGTFRYISPDDRDREQFKKLLGKDNINAEFNSICLFYTVEFENEIDTAGFLRSVVNKDPRKRLVKSQRLLLERLDIFTQSKLAGEIRSEVPGSFFLAEFDTDELGPLVYCEDPSSDDLFRLYSLRKIKGHKINIVLSGYTPDESLLSQRGVIPFDITRYNINGSVDDEGYLELECVIHYKLLRWGWRYLEFKLSDDMKIVSAFDSEGNPLGLITRNGASVFGLVLNNPPDLMVSDSVRIKLKGKPFKHEWTIYYSDDSVQWYPENIIRDYAKFDIELNHPEKFQVILNGFPDSSLENISLKKRWKIENPVSKAQFYMGRFLDIENSSNLGKYCRMFIPIAPQWGNDTMSVITRVGQYYSWKITWNPGELSDLYTKYRHLTSSSKILRDLDVFESIFGPSPFDSLIFIEDPRDHVLGRGGIIGLSSYPEKLTRVADPIVRAHETAHQWWGENVAVDSYRDLWIIEGLAEYSAYMALQNPVEGEKVPENIPLDWANSVFNDSLLNQYPLWVIPRLDYFSSDSYDYSFFSKSAYIFHMIRYLLWDCKEKSDAPFIMFLRELSAKYRLNAISTSRYKRYLRSTQVRI